MGVIFTASHYYDHHPTLLDENAHTSFAMRMLSTFYTTPTHAHKNSTCLPYTLVGVRRLTTQPSVFANVFVGIWSLKNSEMRRCGVES